MLNVILEKIISKKRVIGWIASAVFAIGAVAVGMSGADFKAAVCDAPVMEQK